MEERNAKITVHMVLQARAKMCANKVNGPEDAVVSEMIKQLPLEKIYINKNEVVPRTFHGSDGDSKFVEDCEIGVLTET